MLEIANFMKYTVSESILLWKQRSTKLLVLSFINRGQCGYAGPALSILCSNALLSPKREKYYIIKSNRKQSSSHPGISGNSISFIVSEFLCWILVSPFAFHIKPTMMLVKNFFILVWILSLVYGSCLSPRV